MNMEKATEALKTIFGFPSFRPMQAEIIQAVFSGKDVFVLMPTGGGKSLCYQIPAIVMPGCCVVVSPLISLMKDQVEALRANGVKAAFLNSTQIHQEQRQVEDDFYNDELDLLYVSPEKLVSQEFQPLLQRSKVNLFAIDEAHCISAWGHDFRPEYTQMQFLRGKFPTIPIIALTATADRVTRGDIVEQLNLKNPQIYIASFDRPNLNLEVRPGQKRLQQIERFIKERPGEPGIIYCLSRKNTEELADKLAKRGFQTTYYHAKMSARDRDAAQEAFVEDRVQVICATVAFGMGIDKSNVRWVMHYNLPKNVESYYQEIGRAGRDGLKADTVLFYSYADMMVLKDILSNNEGQLNEVKLAKLERMYQYATAPICRRRILLSYFGEERSENCGNCDVCKNPPVYFDGTVIAQKALSAVARLREQVGLTMVINILRGSGQRAIIERGYDQIKTFGAGRDLSYQEWMQYMEQLLNLGLIEIAHERHNALQLTPASKAVLFEGKKVELVKPDVIEKRKAQEKQAVVQTLSLKEELFLALKKLRLEEARKRGVPPYVVFSDVTLQEMAEKRPMTDAAMEEITGVGARKLFLYGETFIQAIRLFARQKISEGRSVKGATYIETLELYKQGKTVEEIAILRGLNPGTISGHLSALYEEGETMEVSDFIEAEELQRVQAILETMPEPYALKPIFEALNEEVGYDKIRWAIAATRREAMQREATS